MGLNFALERKKFIEEQERLRKEYEAAGMTPEQIDEMYEHDLHRFNRDIAYQRHTQPLLPESMIPDEDKNPLYKKFCEKIAVVQVPSESTRFWWIDEIEDVVLVESLKKIPEEELELLDLLAFQEFTQLEISKAQGKTQSSISQRIATIRKKIKKSY